MIENVKILTGSQSDVAKKANTFLASHPNAKILGNSVTTHVEQDPKDAKKSVTVVTSQLVVGIES